jgi:DNA-binding GntR family transcriptional regulator
VDRVFDHCRAAIIDGTMPPLLHLVEQQLAAQLQVSRAAVRDALARLCDRRLAIMQAGGRRRVVVVPMSGAELRELSAMLGALEGVAAAKLAKQPTAERSAAAHALQRVQDRFAALCARPQLNEVALLQQHTRFHESIVSQADLPELQAVHASLLERAMRYDWIYPRILGGLLDVSIAEHQRVIDAIRDGAAERATKAIRLNYTSSAGRLGIRLDRQPAFHA